jgi:hypothetical protein
MKTISVLEDFSEFPALRHSIVSDESGEKFYHNVLNKAFKEAYLYVISRIMTRVRERLNTGLDSTYHVVVNNFYVSRFTEYNPK